MSGHTFSVDDVFDELDKRVTSLEKNMPDYLADLLEIGRSVGTTVEKLVEDSTV